MTVQELIDNLQNYSSQSEIKIVSDNNIKYSIEDIKQENNNLNFYLSSNSAYTEEELKILKIIFELMYELVSVVDRNGAEIINWGEFSIDRNTIYTIAEKLGVEID